MLLNNIQALRAFAALNVVFHHIIDASNIYSRPVMAFATLKGWGPSGVDIFFVVSGFVMVYTQAVRPKTCIEFLENRIIRVVPLYWVLTTLLIGIFLFAPEQFRSMSLTFAHILSSYTFTSVLITEKMPLLYVGWTLEWEMLFYILFGLGLVISWNKPRVIFPTIALILIVSWIQTGLILLEFVLGMFCAQLFLAKRFLGYGGIVLAIGSICLLASIWLKLDWDRFFLWGIPSAMIVYGLLSVKQTNSRLLVFLGAASYSTYLVQVFTIPVFYKIVAPQLTAVDGDILALLCLLSTAVVGCFTYLFLEKPISVGLRQIRFQAKEGLAPE